MIRPRFRSPAPPIPGFLFRLPQAGEVGIEDALHATGVLAIAEEGFLLEAECPDLASVLAKLGDFGCAVVELLQGVGVVEIKFSLSHGVRKLSEQVIGVAM